MDTRAHGVARSTSHTRGVYIFRNDLRIQHNIGLARIAARVDHLDCVCIVPPDMVVASAEEQMFMLGRRYPWKAAVGSRRKRFYWQAILDLHLNLQQRGGHLSLLTGHWGSRARALLDSGAYSVVGLSAHPGYYEQSGVDSLVESFPDIEWVVGDDFCLLAEEQLPFALTDMPQGFTPFREAIEPLVQPGATDTVGTNTPVPALPDNLPPASDRADDNDPMMTEGFIQGQLLRLSYSGCGAGQIDDETTQMLTGGETAGLARVNHYIHDGGAIRHYKDTRNALMGDAFSSKFSAWLALGCVSPRMLVDSIFAHESKHGENDSTYWLRFELIWREYFQWLSKAHGARLFAVRGIKGVNPLLTYNAENFMAWREGYTQSPFVNAFMRQLKYTGWMSNRGRQIVASYLVNELGVDWRYGAGWFESQLMDYDCATNWGNWQYLAGVGTDPRGKRHFNIDKQQAEHDPNGTFTRFWSRADGVPQSA